MSSGSAGGHVEAGRATSPPVTPSPRLLLVEQSSVDRAIIEHCYPGRVTTVASAADALAAVEREAFAAIMLGSEAGKSEAAEVVRRVRAVAPATPVVLLIEPGEEDAAAAAFRAGAAACIVKRPGYERALADATAAATGLATATPSPPTPPPPAAPASADVLIFELDGVPHALRASAVREVLHAVALAPIPGVAPGLEGVLDPRGRVVPVLDLRRRLGLPSRGLAPSDHLIVLEAAGDELVAVRTDRVREIVPAHVVDATGGAAVAQTGHGLVALHDVRRLTGGHASTAASRATEGW